MSPPSGAAWKLARLSCPRCGGGLDPLSTDVVYHCQACGGACELVEGRTVERGLAWLAVPAGGAQPDLTLPFWRLGPGRITPAFNATRLLTLTTCYSERFARAELPLGKAGRGLWGGSIGSSDARRVCRMALEDADPAGPSSVPAVLGISFRRETNHLVCLTTGFHIYLETIEGAARLLDRWAARKT